MADYSPQLATANRLLQEKGMAMIFVQNISNGKDPDTGYLLPDTVTETSFYGVRTKPTTQEVAAGLYASDALIVLMGGDVVSDAKTTDELVFDNHKWDILSVASVAPAEQVILWKMSVRDAGEIE